MLTKKRSQYTSAFTIVELLIVIVVIAILASVTTVAFVGIQKRAVASTMKDTLTKVARAMDVAAVDSNSYAALPTAITLPDGVGIALMQPQSPATTATTYCINATSQKYDDIIYSIEKGGSPKEEPCTSTTILAMTSHYNTNATSGGQPDSTVMSSVGTASASGAMNFRAETDEIWSQVTLSWDKVDGATRYMLNGKRSTDANWYSFTTTCGSTSWDTTSYSGGITPPATSYTISAGVMCIPQNASQAHDYRVRYLKDGVWSDWTQLSISPLTSPHRSIPKIKNFTVTQASNWLSATFNWDAIGTFANLPGVKIRLNYRTSSTGAWYAFTATCGMTSWNATSYSGGIAPTATTFAASHATTCQLVPANAGQTYEYRAQLYSGNEEGEWTAISLNPLSYAGETGLPKVNNFTVTPSSDWSSITFNWQKVPERFKNVPKTKIRINFKDASWAETGWVSITSGCGNSSWNADLGGGAVSLDDTSFTASGGSGCKPSTAGKTYEYRIQVWSGSVAGDWTTIQLSR